MSPEPIAQGTQRRAIDLVRPLQLVELAGQHARAARARQLGVPQVELAALEHMEALGPLAPGELAHRLGLSSGGVTGIVHRLRRAGWVDRARHPRDRRMRLLSVTAAGTAHLAELMRPVHEPAMQTLRWTPADDVARLEWLLEALATSGEQSAAQTSEPISVGEADERTSALLM